MLVWINGPFGGGKTQVAFEIRRRLAGSVVCDPEQVGYGLHRTMPRQLRRDFQDFPAWRQGVYEVLDRVLAEYDGVVLAPMTVVEPDYFAETVGRLRESGHDVRHFALLARHDTIRERVRRRGVYGLVADDFALGKLDRCLDQLRRSEFAEHVWTDDIDIPAVAERIADSAGLPLSGRRDRPLLDRLRRTWVSLTHARR
ncbi:AAA family ATPase [Nocardia sp. CDC159]|uniref:AAA family ATPase n=1 Tax=Nocardia pulmonis TaxID=2951408 RepID=A0A9X2IXQ8_9NOCA|nr:MULTISPECIES: AAA family ATPase [Nocardia]MCM6774894.1 AAA family ATPase [Nocardia pulmonis]MCM6789825.1 AAA family ATPase [Nocardia sp. CDC159]